MMNVFDESFEKVISLWPETLLVSDKVHHKNGGASIPKLTFVHDEIQNNIEGFDGNEMLIQMDWAIYTVLHQAARNQDEISPKNIDREKVRTIFERNLGWDDAKENGPGSN